MEEVFTQETRLLRRAFWLRPPEAVARDVRNGLVSRTAAREAYAVALSADGTVDQPATHALRADPKE